jgi:hypothetical protein
LALYAALKRRSSTVVQAFTSERIPNGTHSRDSAFAVARIHGGQSFTVAF